MQKTDCKITVIAQKTAHAPRSMAVVNAQLASVGILANSTHTALPEKHRAVIKGGYAVVFTQACLAIVGLLLTACHASLVYPFFLFSRVRVGALPFFLYCLRALCAAVPSVDAVLACATRSIFAPKFSQRFDGLAMRADFFNNGAYQPHYLSHGRQCGGIWLFAVLSLAKALAAAVGGVRRTAQATPKATKRFNFFTVITSLVLFRDWANSIRGFGQRQVRAASNAISSVFAQSTSANIEASVFIRSCAKFAKRLFFSASVTGFVCYDGIRHAVHSLIVNVCGKARSASQASFEPSVFYHELLLIGVN